MEGTYILSVLVEDHPGILTRVAGLFSRRGYKSRRPSGLRKTIN